ncbi:sodium:proton antiporter [Xylanimonas oleitrophica]|uniref:Sodium:proton antiporter n=1 Tax=Xylanimonas oleitrophica TaxID=2607479 RepID=A0A2W5WY41_9MICO|nr:DUF6328 family protein [Xylanimonas oleitrophica]PZR53196.1 sodium:proton antiporter [Xylanimonas oleitrophica]
MSDDSVVGPGPGSGHQQGRAETPEERSDRNWNELLQELRVMQTGVQILTGFLLTLPFQPRFAELTAYQRGVYLVLVLLSAATTGLAIAPVAMHRHLFRRHMKPRLVTSADRMTRAALVLLTLVVAGVVSLVFDVVVGHGAGLVVGGVALVALLALWTVLPALVRRRR